MVQDVPGLACMLLCMLTLVLCHSVAVAVAAGSAHMSMGLCIKLPDRIVFAFPCSLNVCLHACHQL